MQETTNSQPQDLLSTQQHGSTKSVGTTNQTPTVLRRKMQATLEQSWRSCSDLEGWIPSMDVPKTVTMTALKSAEAVFRTSLRPAGNEARAVAIKKLLQFGRTNKIEVPDERATMADYNHHLKHLPEDLLELAVDSVIASWKWSNRLPMPGDLLDVGKKELTNRTFQAAKINMALKRKQPERGPAASSEQIDEIMAKHRAEMAKRFPSNRGAL